MSGQQGYGGGGSYPPPAQNPNVSNTAYDPYSSGYQDNASYGQQSGYGGYQQNPPFGGS